jgi:PAS domain-containing protein
VLVAVAASVISDGAFDLMDVAAWVSAAVLLVLILREWRASERRASVLLDEVAQAGHTGTFAGILHADGTYVEDAAVVVGVARILGVEPHEVTEDAWLAAVVAEDVAIIHAARADLLAGNPVNVEYRLLTAAGETRVMWERTRPGPRLADGSRRIAGVITDVTERRAAEDELAAERGRVAAILAAVDEVVVTLAVDRARGFVVVDGAAAVDRLLGAAERDEDVIERWRDAVHPEDLAVFLSTVETMRAGRPTAAEYRLSGPDGPMRWLWVRTTSREDSDGTRLVDVVVSDTTERRRLASALTEARSQLQDALESVDAALYTLHVDDLGRVEVLYASDGWARLVDDADGTPAERGARLLGLVHADDRVFYEQGNRNLLDGEPIVRTFRLVAGDGIRYLHDRARLRTRLDGVEVVDGVLVDVTRSRRAEEALGEAQEDIARIVESIDELLWRSELGGDGQWRTVFAGPGGAAYLGLPEAIARDVGATDVLWLDAVLEEDREPYLKAWGELSTSIPLDVSYRVQTRDGETRWLVDRAKARFAADGALIADGITIDITEQRRVADELGDLRAGLQRISASFGVFHYTIELDEQGRETAVAAGDGWHDFMGQAGTPADMAREWDDAVLPEDRALFRHGGAELVRGHAIETRYRIRTVHGDVRWIVDRAAPRRRADGVLVAEGVVMDVTAKVEAERERDAARARLEAIAARVDIGFYTSSWDDGRWSATFHEGSWDPTGGAPAGHEAFAAWFDRVHPDDRQLVEEGVSSAVVGQTDELLYRIVDDGETRWIIDRAQARDAGAGVAPVIDGVVVDVTAAVARGARDGSGSRAAAALAAAGIRYAEVRVAGGGVRLVSDAAALCPALLGAPYPDGLDPLALLYAAVRAEDRPDLLAALGAIVAAGGTGAFTVALTGLDGVERTFVATVTAFGMTDGTAVTAVIVPRRDEAAADRTAALLDAIDEIVREDALEPDGSWSIRAGHERLGALLGVQGGADDVGRAFAAAVVDEDRVAVKAHRVRLAGGNASSVEYRVRGGDGGLRVLWERARPRVVADRLLVLSVTADVTSWHPDGDVDRLGARPADLS